MNPAQRFLFDEAVEGLDAEGELAQSQGTFGAESPLSESFEMLGCGVLRALDDAEVLAAAAFDGGLDEAASSLDDPLDRFHDHPFPTAFGSFFPPGDALGLTLGVGEVADLVRRREEELIVLGTSDVAARICMPGLMAVLWRSLLRARTYTLVVYGAWRSVAQVHGPALN